MNERLADLLGSYDCGKIVIIDTEKEVSEISERLAKRGYTVKTLGDDMQTKPSEQQLN